MYASPLELLSCVAYIARVLRVCGIAMDNNCSWSILASTHARAALPPLYLVPFMLWTREPAGLLQGRGETARDTEGSGRRRVMTTRNTDGQAYTLEEFIEYFKDRSIGTREFERAAPVHESLCRQMDQRSGPPPGANALEEEDQEESNDKTFLAIKNALIRLLDEGEAPAVPLRRRGFKQKNDKLPRRALVWARFLKKMLLLMYNDRTGRFCSGRISAIGESA
jgi:hypothetical protein